MENTTYYYNLPYGVNLWQMDVLNRYAYYYMVSTTPSTYVDEWMYALNKNAPVPLNGSSKSGITGNLSNYPQGHWLVIEGYTNSGATFKIVDPASGLSGFTSVAKKYNVSSSEVLRYVSYGIIW